MNNNRFKMMLLSLLVTYLVLVEGKWREYSLRKEFEVWKDKYGKVYHDPEEEMMRFGNWQRNLVAVDKHNGWRNGGFKMEMNAFADKDFDDLLRAPVPSTRNHSTTSKLKSRDVPDSLDWRTKGAVLPVQNQGHLGSAQAFAITDSVASLHFIQTGKLVRLSVEETVDCCARSGLMSPNPFICTRYIGGLCSEADYPHSSTNQTCRNSSCTATAQVKGGMTVRSGDEDALKEAVARNPVLVAVDASHPSFQMYKDGIYYEPQCNKRLNLDHAMLVVGYGSENGRDYWIVQNSWGKDWGMDGYILMSRNRGNNCGIASMASLPY